MRRKNLIVLLLLPFLISTLTIVSVNVSYNLVDVDISYIEWDYDDIEAFKLTDTPYLLSARGVNRRYTDVGKGNELIWSVKNRDSSDAPYASIVQNNGYYYLKTNLSGEVDVTCSNQKGNVSRTFRLIIYENGAIIINSQTPSSRYGKIDPTTYYGQYDFAENGSKKQAEFGLNVTLIPESLKDANPKVIVNGDIEVDIDFNSGSLSNGGYATYGKVFVGGGGKASIEVTTDISDMSLSGGKYEFEVITDGVNVYDYEDLLLCTNKSDGGEITVLQTSFESYEDYLALSDSQCFGYITGGRFSFSVSDGTLYSFTTKYNHQYLDQWNAANPDSKVSLEVLAGLRVQKDFYGNGYQINFHNLAYPTSTIEQSGVTVPQLSASDLFRGPLPFYTVGSPSMSGADGFNIVTAYGQDNIGFYIDGDNITVNDVKLQNASDVNVLSFLDTTGTVVEVDGDNITLKNMRMSNGKNVLRSFSNLNLTITNCMLSSARNFLFLTGANEYIKADGAKQNTFNLPGQTITANLRSFLTEESIANSVLNDYLNGKIGSQYSFTTKALMKNVLTQLQDALSVDLSGQYKGSTQIDSCLFYKSGISSIALESLFNGPFLYSSSLPTSISTFLNLFNSGFMPSEISGTSYPVEVNISGTTKFYDYKTLKDLDVSGLIDENISTLAQMMNKNYTIDDIFPIKSMLSGDAVYYSDGESDYINMPIAFFGGGKNYSRVTFIDYEDNHINGRLSSYGTLDEDAIKKVSLLDNYLDLPVVDPVGFLGQFLPQETIDRLGIEVDENTLIKTVTIVTGYEPFKFIFNKGDGYLFGESPKIEEMQALAATNALTSEAQNA